MTADDNIEELLFVDTLMYGRSVYHVVDGVKTRIPPEDWADIALYIKSPWGNDGTNTEGE